MVNLTIPTGTSATGIGLAAAYSYVYGNTFTAYQSGHSLISINVYGTGTGGTGYWYSIERTNDPNESATSWIIWASGNPATAVGTGIIINAIGSGITGGGTPLAFGNIFAFWRVGFQMGWSGAAGTGSSNIGSGFAWVNPEPHRWVRYGQTTDNIAGRRNLFYCQLCLTSGSASAE